MRQVGTLVLRAVCCALLMAVGTASTEAFASEWDAKRKALAARYQLNDVVLEATDLGFSGAFVLAGKLTPQGFSPARSADTLTIARGAAAAFFSAEPQLLGQAGSAVELVEQRAVVDEHGRHHLKYDAYVAGIRIADVVLGVHADASGELIAVNGSLKPLGATALAGIREAETSRIPEEALLPVIADDLEAREGVRDVVLDHAEPLALPAPPFVIWDATVRLPEARREWRYRIDAVSAEIVWARESVQTEESTVGEGKSDAGLPTLAARPGRAQPAIPSPTPTPTHEVVVGESSANTRQRMVEDVGSGAPPPSQPSSQAAMGGE